MKGDLVEYPPSKGQYLIYPARLYKTVNYHYYYNSDLEEQGQEVVGEEKSTADQFFESEFKEKNLE